MKYGVTHVIELCIIPSMGNTKPVIIFNYVRQGIAPDLK